MAQQHILRVARLMGNTQNPADELILDGIPCALSIPDARIESQPIGQQGQAHSQHRRDELKESLGARAWTFQHPTSRWFLG